MADGVAVIPIASADNVYGIVRTSAKYGITISGDKTLIPFAATEGDIKARNSYRPILTTNIDAAVKTAMCDGKGAVWTDAERQAALARMGCTVGDDGTVKFTTQET